MRTRIAVGACILAGIVCVATAGTSSADAARQDEYTRGYGFKVEISPGPSPDSANPQHWWRVSGGGLRLQTEGHSLGGSGKQPSTGMCTWEDIVITAAINPARTDLLQWFRDTQDKKSKDDDARTVKVTLIDRDGSDMVSINYTHCFLTSYTLITDFHPSTGLTTAEQVRVTVGGAHYETLRVVPIPEPAPDCFGPFDGRLDLDGDLVGPEPGWTEMAVNPDTADPETGSPDFLNPLFINPQVANLSGPAILERTSLRDWLNEIAAARGPGGRVNLREIRRSGTISVLGADGSVSEMHFRDAFPGSYDLLGVDSRGEETAMREIISLHIGQAG